MLKGYRTLIVNVVAFFVAIGTMFGLDIAPEAQTEITVGVLAVANIVLRFVTTTPIGDVD